VALGLLNEDLRDTDCLLDLWSDNDEDFNDVALERCVYSVRVRDEAGKLNVNTASKDQLMGLPYMTDEIADAIIDWRDNDENPQGEGAEAGYYENLAFPYTMRNGPLRTIRELLRVKGMTKDLLYGEDTNLNGEMDYGEMDGEASPPLDNGDDYLDQGWIAYLTCYSYENNVDAQGQKRININQANERQLERQLGLSRGQAQWIAQNRGGGFDSIADLVSNNSPEKPANGAGDSNNNSPEPIDMQTFSQIADRVTITNETKIPGKVNINTAPKEVLVALFGGGDEAERLAETIVAERAGQLYGFQSIADLMNLSSVKLSMFKNIANQITVRSDVFTIRCFASADVSGATLQTECVVDRGETPCTILYWYQGANY
jgi:DNA uptake protein ComE-like DNA-binding protein